MNCRLVLLLVTLPDVAAAQRPAAPDTVRARRFVETLMHRPSKARRPDGSIVDVPTTVPGMSVAVAVDGKVVWARGFGFADIEQHVPATAATKYRIGSVSKLITAAALARLVERRAFDLDAPIQQHVPTFPMKSQPITARLLAGHLAGIRHYRIPDEVIAPPPVHDLVKGLEIFANDSLIAAPGTKYAYSSYGFNLLGVALQSAAHEPYLALVRRLVLEPLGLTSTTADFNDSLIVARAAPYEQTRDNTIVNAAFDDVRYKWPSGGFLSTATDLARFGAAHVRPGFLADSTLRTLFTSQRLASGAETGVGIAWRIGTDSTGRRYYHHGGTATGGRAVLLVWPRERVVVAMVANLVAPFDERDAATIAALFAPSAAKSPDQEQPAVSSHRSSVPVAPRATPARTPRSRQARPRQRSASRME
jgi:CubicO group peptidase (beta-lactamase class C family)